MTTIAQLSAALAGRYEIERELGRGGMATVYLARDLRHARPVALKVLNPELGAVLGTERFLAEIQVTANLQHPNLLPLFDSGEAPVPGYRPGAGLLYYVMPYVAGESLRARLARERQLPVEEAVQIATAVAGALDHAHRHGVIHRDLKPENILLHEGQPLVADFGIARAVSVAGGERLTQTGLSLGTPQYMSPEQATGERVIDARSDVYSLGCVLYEMLTGEPPHTGATAQAIVARLLTETPRGLRLSRPNVPPHVESAVARALEKLPADRFATAREFVDALRDGPTVALRDDVAREPATPRWRVAWRSPAVGVAATIGFALGVATGRMMRPSPRLPGRLETHIPREQSIVYLGPAYPPPYGLPNGSGFVYAGVDTAGVDRIFRRPYDAAAAEPVPGASGEVARAWVFPSPDGTQLALLTVPGLQTFVMPLAGGEPRHLTD